MRFLPARLGVMVAATGAVMCLTAIPASAQTVVAAPPPTGAFAFPARWCPPAHPGPNWRWDGGRRGAHWDHRVWNRRFHRWDWQHVWWDTRFCAWTPPGGPPPRGGAPGPQGPQGPPPGNGGPGPQGPRGPR